MTHLSLLGNQQLPYTEGGLVSHDRVSTGGRYDLGMLLISTCAAVIAVGPHLQQATCLKFLKFQKHVSRAYEKTVEMSTAQYYTRMSLVAFCYSSLSLFSEIYLYLPENK